MSLFLLALEVGFLSVVVPEYCPSRFPNDTLVDYRIKERFDSFRRAHPVYVLVFSLLSWVWYIFSLVLLSFMDPIFCVLFVV